MPGLATWDVAWANKAEAGGTGADKMGRPNRLQADSEEAVVTVMQDAASEGWRREGSRYLHRWVRYWKGGKAVDGVVFAWKDTHESNFLSAETGLRHSARGCLSA